MYKEEFKRVGYVYFGYISPELSSENTYPDYIKENVLEAKEKIRAHQTESAITFAFMTDLHYSSTKNHDIRTQRLMNAYRELKRDVQVDKLILGGDYLNDGTKEYKTNNYISLRNFLKDERYFPVNGNHDDNSIWDLCIENEVSENHLSPKELYDLFFDHLPDLGAEFNKKAPGLYYVYNDKEQKVRYIFLDTNDIPYSIDENGKLNYTKQHLFALSQNQLDWLVNEALCFDENGWDIIIISHNFYKFAEGGRNNKESERLKVLGDVLDAYQNGKDIDRDYFRDEFFVHCKAEFSKAKRGHIIACFAGHHHADFAERTDGGIPVIYTSNLMMYHPCTPERNDGDKSELLFDVVTIDRKEKAIYMTRVGAGEDRIIRYE
ncbi:MAG: metallophosphoesterase [Clostridia bacterium]|nr:metallophosphoesterase [Clostridia bacterium]